MFCSRPQDACQAEQPCSVKTSNRWSHVHHVQNTEPADTGAVVVGHVVASHTSPASRAGSTPQGKGTARLKVDSPCWRHKVWACTCTAPHRNDTRNGIGHRNNCMIARKICNMNIQHIIFTNHHFKTNMLAQPSPAMYLCTMGITVLENKNCPVPFPGALASSDIWAWQASPSNLHVVDQRPCPQPDGFRCHSVEHAPATTPCCEAVLDGGCSVCGCTILKIAAPPSPT